MKEDIKVTQTLFASLGWQRPGDIIDVGPSIVVLTTAARLQTAPIVSQSSVTDDYL
jgi:hypothetical protein